MRDYLLRIRWPTAMTKWISETCVRSFGQSEMTTIDVVMIGEVANPGKTGAIVLSVNGTY